MLTTYSKKAGWILLAVSILGIMIQTDFTAVTVALVPITESVKTDLATVQWVLSAYVLAWGSLVLTTGRCADLYGKRRTFLLGTLFFMLGSAFTGAATQAWFLIFGRVIQGIGGALFLPGLYTLIFTNFPEHKRGMALGILTSAIAIGMAIGPTVGGLIIKLLSWRWIFFLNLPLGIPVIAIIMWAVEREPWRVTHESMDYLGATLIALTLFILMFAFDRVLVWGITSNKFLLSILASIVLSVFFIFYERRRVHPLIQMAIFKNRTFFGCILTYFFVGINFAIILIIGGLYLQNALGYSPIKTGFIFLIMTATFAILSLWSGKLADRIDPRIPIVIGGVLMCASLIAFAFSTQHNRIWVPMLDLGLAGAGFGFISPALNTTMLKSVPHTLLSTASSAYAMFGCVGNSVGLILSSGIIVTFGRSKLMALLSKSMTLNPAQSHFLKEVVGSTHYTPSQLKSFPTDQTHFLMDSLRTAFIHGMHTCMWATLILTLISIVISLLLIKPSPKSLGLGPHVHML